MLVRNRMTRKVVTARAEWPLEKARAALRRERIRQLPVVRQGRVAGIVADRDLRAAAARAKTVADVMTLNPVTISPEASVDEAASVLRKRKFNALPVVERGKLAGILTASDILDAFIELSGVAEPSYRITVKPRSAGDVSDQLRHIVTRHHGELRWLHQERGKSRAPIHLRVKVRAPGDIVDALEGAGHQVESVVFSKTKGLLGKSSRGSS
jgi:acetoin utilization protein AcuB